MTEESRTFGLGWAAWILEAGLLFALPLIFYRGFADQFSTAKVVLTESLIVLGLAAWGLGLAGGKLHWPAPFHLILPLGLLAVAVLVSCLASSVPSFSLTQAEYFLCGPLWFLLLVTWRHGGADVRRVGIFSVAAGSIAAGIALLQWWGRDPLLFGGYHVAWGTMVPRMRLYSTFGNPNFLCGYLIGAIFPAMALARCAGNLASRIAFGAAATLMLIATLGTGSYGGWAALVVGGVAATFILARMGKAPPRSGNVEKVHDPGILRSALSPLWIGALWAAVSLDPSLESRVLGRIYLWRIGWQMFSEHPVLGSGWGTFQLRFLEHQVRFLAAHPGWTHFWTMTRELHSDPFQILLEAGLVGFAAFVWLLTVYARDLGATARSADCRGTTTWLSASAGGTVAILTNSLFNYQFDIPPILILLFTLLAVPQLLMRRDESNSQDPGTASGTRQGPRRRAIFRGLPSLALMVLCGFWAAQIARRAYAEHEYALGKNLEERGDVAGAETADRMGLSQEPANGKLHFALARVLYLQGRYPQALSEILLAEPTWSDSHLEVLKARVLDKMGRASPALESYRHALSLDPTLKTVQADIERLTQVEGVSVEPANP